MTFSPIPSDQVFVALQEQEKVDPFTRLVATFLHHFKGVQLSSHEVARRAAKAGDRPRAQAFLAVFEPIFERYQQSLSRQEEIDFHDMINKAAKHVEAGRFLSPFRYILVDEFQDISPGRARLLKALLDQSPDAQLFAVGDDWQSIYRFTGSDIAIMREFADHFGHTEQTYLETTFRCAHGIADVATKFVLCNPAQIFKEVSSTRRADGPCVHVRLEAEDLPLLGESVGRSLAASEAEVTRIRLGLEGAWRGIGSIVPSFEIGVRQDGGDAETGFGADIGAGLAWSDPAQGIEAEIRARGLLTHEDSSFRERGFTGSFAWDPDPASDLGPSLTLRQTVGASATGGADALLAPESAQALIAANDDEDDVRNRRLEATLGYGIPAFGGRYMTTPAIGFGLTEAEREYSHSWRLAEAKSAGLVFGLDVEAVRREHVTGDTGPEHRFVFGLGWQLEGARREGAAFGVRLEGSRSDTANDNARPETVIAIRVMTIW